MSPDVYQVYPDTCAIKSQQLILQDFGIDLPQEQLINEAMNMGIYEPGSGTQPVDVGKLLDLHGVPCTATHDATILDLTRALAQGHKVIIGVDSGELWNAGSHELIEDFMGEVADHALIVAGIDVSTNEVILTDPGSGNEGARYPLEQFLDAWQDSGNFMVETQAPAPSEFCPEMVGFDYDAGHIDTIGAMPWDFFEHSVLPLPLHDMSGMEITFDMPNAGNPIFSDFHQMVQGHINGFSPETITLINELPDIADIDDFDLSFEPVADFDGAHDLLDDDVDDLDDLDLLDTGDFI
jgi:hypothetical protein